MFLIIWSHESLKNENYLLDFKFILYMVKILFLSYSKKNIWNGALEISNNRCMAYEC